MNTLYKILTPILTLVLVPILIFVPLIQLTVTSKLLGGNVLTSLGGFKSDNISVYNVYERVTGTEAESSQITDLVKGLFKDKFDVNKLIEAIPTINYLYAAAAFLAVVIIISLLIIIFSIFTKKKLLCTLFSFVNMGLLFGMTKCFDAFSKPFTNGTLGLSQIIGALGIDLSSLGSNLGALKNLAQGLNILSFDAFKISLFYPAAMMLFFIIGIFTFCMFMSERYSQKD